MAPLSEALQEAPGSLGTVRNAVLLLELLAEGPAYQQLTDLADRSGLTLPTVHRLLRSLALAGLVEQDVRSARYGLGPQLVRLAHRYLARHPVLGALAPYLTQIRETTGATVRVQLLVGTSVVDVDRVDGPDAGLYREPNSVRPALACVAGRLLGARGDDERWKLLLAEVDEATRALAERERDTWEAAGYLSSDPVSGMLRELAVPVLASPGHGMPLAALVVELPVRSDPEQIEAFVVALTRAASAAARTLGHG